MKKKYLYYIILIMYSPFIFAQTVSVNSIYVNSVYSQSINLGSNSSSNVTLSVLVTLPAAQSNSNPGTINVYYKRNTSASAIVGGYGGNLLFNGGTNATRGFSINLSASEFDTSGGILYAEYKTFLGIIYKSGNISIIKNADTGGGGTLIRPNDAPNPAKIANTLCCNQTVRLGDKPQTITGSQYSNPYANYSYGINSSWSANGNRGVKFLDFKSSALNIDYIADLQNFTITRNLGYNNTSNLKNKSNTITITVVPSPILSNLIQTNTPINTDGFAEFSSLKDIAFNSLISKVNLNILQDPFHINRRGDILDNVDSYRWEYAKINKDYNPYAPKYWITIPESKLNNFNPSSFSEIEDAYYIVRRIATYKSITRVSNEIKIMTRGIRHDNTICCDQKLKISSATQIENPSSIIGSTPIFQNANIQGEHLYYTTSYQWQSKTINDEKGWVNILGATSKDYLPSQTLKIINDRNRGRNSFTLESSYEYRRIAILNYQILVNGAWVYGTESCYSNEVSLSSSSKNSSELKIYPNPASSILNIDSPENLTNAKINIINTLGVVVNSNNYLLVNSNLASIDVSNLLIGTYFIIIDYGYYTVQKTFIKN